VTAVDMHHLVEGRPDAPTVVLAGSLGSTLAMWDPQVPALGRHLRVVRYDARGHGGSPVPAGPYSIDDLVDDLVALLDTVEVERAHVVGLSLGGMVAMRLAAREPARVDRLALLCTSAVLSPPEAWAERAALVRADGTGAVAQAVVGRWLTDQRRLAHPEEVQRLVAMIAATPAEGYASCCTAIEKMDLRPDLPRITAPTLVIGGAEDLSMPRSHQEAIVAAVPGARLRIVEHAAHLASFEQPDTVNALLLEHLTSDTDT
jgi:3-oxoadipate enol-lactonase